MSNEVRPFAVGDRVSWMGGIDFGSREVRWTGIIIALGFGVPVKFKVNALGETVEDGPRAPAAMVRVDPGQHGIVPDSRYAGTERDPVVRLDALTPAD